MFTLGPSLRSLLPDRYDLNREMFVTVAHGFQVKDYSGLVVGKPRFFVCHPNGTPFHCHEDLNDVGRLIHIPVDADNKTIIDVGLISVDNSEEGLLVGHNGYISPDRVKFPGGPARRVVNQDSLLALGEIVYKNGGTTGLTRGTIFSLATLVIPSKEKSALEGQIISRGIVVVQAFGAKFSDDGDSGSPVWVAHGPPDNPTEAEVIGIVIAGFTDFPWYSVVQPLGNEQLNELYTKAEEYCRNEEEHSWCTIC
mmetsp:Transcript_12214/g.18314  ORF Transcript_12214/g.18314 Transcript_12214/m.18314 type:complete len:253 (-) Transcript_12214:166-924(-)